MSRVHISRCSDYKPVLTIMDAVVGMEGDGPSGGNPRPIGVLLTFMDGAATALVNMSPYSVLPLAAAVRRGLTTGR